jgi:hypothetical protein
MNCGGNHCTTLHCTAMNRIVLRRHQCFLHCTTLHCTALPCTALRRHAGCNTSYRPALHCLHQTALLMSGAALHCTAPPTNTCEKALKAYAAPTAMYCTALHALHCPTALPTAGRGDWPVLLRRTVLVNSPYAVPPEMHCIVTHCILCPGRTSGFSVLLSICLAALLPCCAFCLPVFLSPCLPLPALPRSTALLSSRVQCLEAEIYRQGRSFTVAPTSMVLIQSHFPHRNALAAMHTALCDVAAPPAKSIAQ